jgi:hypothetical protein
LFNRSFVTGGRMSTTEPIRSTRTDARRLRRSYLKGEKPADLPVQAPTKYELAINLKTKALGLSAADTARPR